MAAYRLVAFAVAAVMAGTNLPTPLYSAYQERFGFSPVVLTVIFAVYIAAVLPGLMLFGPIADAVGRRPVLMIAVASSALGSLLLALAAGTPWLLAGRIAQGVSFAAVIGTGASALLELHPERDEGAAATMTTAVFMGGAGVGPLMTGLLAQYAPAPFVLTYVVHIGILAVAGGVLVAIREPLPPAQRTRWRPRLPGIPRSMLRWFALASAAASAAAASGALFLALSSSFSHDLLRTGNLAIGGSLVALFLLSGVAGQAVGRRAAAGRVGAAGLLLVAAGLVLATLAKPAQSVILLALGAATAGAGQGASLRATLTMVGQLAPDNRRADVTSTFYAMAYAVTGSVAIGLGVIATAASLYVAVLTLTVGVGGATVVMAVAMWRSSSRSGIGARGVDSAEPTAH